MFPCVLIKHAQICLHTYVHMHVYARVRECEESGATQAEVVSSSVPKPSSASLPREFTSTQLQGSSVLVLLQWELHPLSWGWATGLLWGPQTD